jgi:parallel beta-helix repeat protein
MDIKNVKVVVGVSALVLLLMFSLSSQAANPQESGPFEADIAVLSENEPRTPISSVPLSITSSGSYYLTQDLQTTGPNQDAIEIDADNVTIDLMGYSLYGPGSGQGRGIYINARANVEIRNGTVRDFGAEGIDEIGMAGPEQNPHYGYGHRIIDVRAIFNGNDGICLQGFSHLVKDCSVSGNGGAGISVAMDSTVTGNLILENLGDGLVALSDSTITGNTVSTNGDDGIEAGYGCMVSGNTVAYNSYFGIWTWDGCAVIDNTAYGNDFGIVVSEAGSLVKSNMLRSNAQTGILVDGGDNAIEQNLVTDSAVGFDFMKCGNFYANNRSAGNGSDYVNTGCQTDGGGNVEF